MAYIMKHKYLHSKEALNNTVWGDFHGLLKENLRMKVYSIFKRSFNGLKHEYGKS